VSNKSIPARSSFYVMFFIFIILLGFNFFYLPGNIISWDFFGYYLYLPFTFIYHDLGFNNQDLLHQIVDKYHNTSSMYMIFKSPIGEWIDKYPIGIAILNIPFFFMGHVAAIIFGYETDGFSAPYQASMLAGSIFYTFLGICFLRKVSLKFFNEGVTIAVLISIVFGTNYFFHTSIQGSGAMPHNYLFTLYTIILWLTVRWHEDFKWKHSILLGIAIGLTIICRGSELICVMIPVLWGIKNKETLMQKWKVTKENILQVIILILVIVLICLPQLLYWKTYAGKYIFNSYGNNAGEGFEFLHPYILQLLFSFRKGWFIYTPIMIFAVIGFINLFKKKKEIYWALFIFFLINIYIAGSWSCWWYAESFSQRSLIQSYPIMALPLGYFIRYVWERKMIIRLLFLSCFFFLILLNLFQSWQYFKGIISGSRMTKDYFFAIFGATEYDPSLDHLLKINRSFDGKEEFKNESDYKMKNIGLFDFEKPIALEKHCDTLFHSGHSSLLMDSSSEYSPAITSTYENITKGDYAWIRITVYVYSTDSFNQNPASVIATFEHKGFSYKYGGYDLEKLNLEPNKWNKVTFDYLTPEVRRPTDKLKVYVWHRGKKPLYIDDLRVDAYVLKPSSN
jgi:hypothetical protein